MGFDKVINLEMKTKLAKKKVLDLETQIIDESDHYEELTQASNQLKEEINEKRIEIEE